MPTVVPRKGSKDEYSNVAYGVCTMSAANTLTFAAITMATGLFQGIAMLLNRILWMPTVSTIREIVAATDSLDMALCSSNRLSSISDITDPAVIAQSSIIGIGVAVAVVYRPFITDFSGLPGGGKLIAANPLYLAAMSAGFVGAGIIKAQLDFTFVELSDRDYLELIQAQFPGNIT